MDPCFLKKDWRGNTSRIVEDGESFYSHKGELGTRVVVEAVGGVVVRHVVDKSNQLGILFFW